MALYATAFTTEGISLAKKILKTHQGELSLPQRLALSSGDKGYETLSSWVEAHFRQGNDLLFVGACGIAVRAIAPFIQDKYTDPSVVVVDQCGLVVIPLLSGHVGGANQLARQIAQTLGAICAIGTATDLQHRFAIDLWAKEKNLGISDKVLAKNLSAQVLQGADVILQSDFQIHCDLPQGMQLIGEGVRVHLSIYQKNSHQLHLIPKILHLGIGCRRGKTVEEIKRAVESVLEEYAIQPQAIATVASIDLKREEKGLIAFAKERNLPFQCHSVPVLTQQVGHFTPSEFVSEITGVDNVCERSAVAQGGTLLVSKQVRDGVTVAIAQEEYVLKD